MPPDRESDEWGGRRGGWPARWSAVRRFVTYPRHCRQRGVSCSGRNRLHTFTLLVAALLAGALARGGAPPFQPLVYEDPQGRFTFAYPPGFGRPSRGTNDGFAGRAAAIRFATFSAEGIGGELVVTHGPPTLDLQAAGGLYDAIAREALPERWRETVVATLPRLTPGNVCRMIGATTHLELEAPALASVPMPQRARLQDLDRLGNVDPVVEACTERNGVTVFQKSARVAAGAPQRPVYGAIRFVEGRYSSVQIVRAGSPPSSAVLEQMRDVVASWRAGPP